MPKLVKDIPITESCYLKMLKTGVCSFGKSCRDIKLISTRNFGTVSLEDYYTLTCKSYNKHLTWKY